MSLISQETEAETSIAKIELERVSKEFQLKRTLLPVLEEIDFFVREGEFVSIIGPSGCGKSTLLNIIAGLEEPASGAIRLDGQPAPRRLGSVAYMHQKDLLLPWRTVLDNAVLGLEVQGRPRVEARQQARDLLETFGLQGFEGQYPSALSGGMRQRTAFLRTVLPDSPVLLLDEPFGALDALTRTDLQAWLLRLCDFLKKTVVLVTHDVEEALLLSDRVYVLTSRPGRVKQVLSVPLPRPREYSLVSTPEFVSLKADLLESLREEDRRADPEPWR